MLNQKKVHTPSFTETIKHFSEKKSHFQVCSHKLSKTSPESDSRIFRDFHQITILPSFVLPSLTCRCCSGRTARCWRRSACSGRGWCSSEAASASGWPAGDSGAPPPAPQLRPARASERPGTALQTQGDRWDRARSEHGRTRQNTPEHGKHNTLNHVPVRRHSGIVAEQVGKWPATRIRVWNGLDQSAGFIIQSSPGGVGLDWIRNSPTQRILDWTGSRNVQCVSHI